MDFANSTSNMIESRNRVKDARALLERARACDPVALGELYDQYAPKMYAYIYRRVGEAATAEDLTSDLFVRMLNAAQNGNIWRQSLSAWLYRIAHNLVVDHYRRRPPLTEVLMDEEAASVDTDPAVVVEQSLITDQLFQGVRQLTPEQQEVLALRFGEGLTAREVGEIVGKSTGAVEALQRRGIAGLRRILSRGEERDDVGS